MSGVVPMYENYGKRIFDIIISLGLIFFLAPLSCILFILVKMDSRGPFLFIQPRIGRDLKEFKIFKIRTMDSETCVRALDVTKTFVTTAVNDPRITKVGHFLRKSHMDELPQLVNVLLGDMSLIGVRPDVPSQVKQYSANFRRKRHLKRPGITGLTQINSFKPGFTANDNFRFDIFYARRKASCFLDCYILYQTVIKLLKMNSF